MPLERHFYMNRQFEVGLLERQQDNSGTLGILFISAKTNFITFQISDDAKIKQPLTFAP